VRKHRKNQQEETRVAGREALLARDEDQALATHTKGGRKKSHFQKETHKESHPQNKSQPKRFQKKGQRKERDYSYVQATIVTRWDILRDIVQLDEKNTRGKIRDIMPMQLKMKSHRQRC
jgi:hypothetical protein